MTTDMPHSTLNPTALSLDDAARVLTAATAGGGGRVPVDWLRADVESGAPLNPDGTLNLVHYAAWLVKEASRAD